MEKPQLRLKKGPVYYNLGVTYGKKHDYVKAKEHFAKAINLGYRNYGTYEGLSWACRMLGQLAEAEKARAEASDSWMPIGFEQFF